MTAPLNKAIVCCDSEVDGQMAGLAVSYEDVLVAVPAFFLIFLLVFVMNELLVVVL